MKVVFNWHEWWVAERFGVIYTTVLCVACAVVSGYIGNWPLAAVFGIAWVWWIFIWCAGWQLLLLGILRLRARLGWITYQSGSPDQ